MRVRVPDHQLNAFVDGELPPPEAAQVAEAVATDPALARRVLHLHRMKAAIAGFSDDLPLPGVPEPVHARRRPRRKLAMCGAMAAMILVMLGAVPALTPESSGADWPMLTQHDQWLNETGTAEATNLPENFAWMEPVMSASGLQLVHTDIRPEAMHLGFRGPNACRLSLFITPMEKPDATLRVSLTEAVQHAKWHIEGVAFEMIARDMAPARFATVATGLHQGSLVRETAADLRIALLQSARLPCVA